tara:strand:+ start:482 stop:667 length:186 start_codon:yes stop_codon:yes gene_type:complete
MTTSSITASSTKAQIIESAEELISSLENRLSKEEKLNQSRKEERNSLIYLLVITSIISILF